MPTPPWCPGAAQEYSLVAVVGGQRLGVRRQQLFAIAIHGRGHAAGDEGRGVFQNPDEFVGELRDLDADRAADLAVRHQEDRQARIAPANRAHELGGLGVDLEVVFALGPVDEDAVDAGVGAGRRDAVLAGRRLDDFHAASVQFGRERAHAAGRRGRMAVAVEAAVDDEYVARNLGCGCELHGDSPYQGCAEPARELCSAM